MLPLKETLETLLLAIVVIVAEIEDECRQRAGKKEDRYVVP